MNEIARLREWNRSRLRDSAAERTGEQSNHVRDRASGRAAEYGFPGGFRPDEQRRFFKTVGQPLLRGRTFTREIQRGSAGRDHEPIARQPFLANGRSGGQPDHVRQWPDVDHDRRPGRECAPADRFAAAGRNPSSSSRGNALTAGALMVRTHGAPGTLSNGLREAIRRVDPQQPITRIETLEQVRTRALASPTLIATLLGCSRCSRWSLRQRVSAECWPFPSTSGRRKSASGWRSAPAAARS